MKYDRWYKRVVRKDLDSARLEIFLVGLAAAVGTKWSIDFVGILMQENDFS